MRNIYKPSTSFHDYLWILTPTATKKNMATKIYLKQNTKHLQIDKETNNTKWNTDVHTHVYACMCVCVCEHIKMYHCKFVNKMSQFMKMKQPESSKQCKVLRHTHKHPLTQPATLFDGWEIQTENEHKHTLLHNDTHLHTWTHGYYNQRTGIEINE